MSIIVYLKVLTSKCLGSTECLPYFGLLLEEVNLQAQFNAHPNSSFAYCWYKSLNQEHNF